MKKNIHNLFSGAKPGTFALALALLTGTAYAQQSYTFSFTGAVQTLNVGGGDYQIECWGADGGDGGGTAAPLTGIAGKGGYSKGVYTATASTIYIYVGEKGQSTNGTGAAIVTALGGWNGGGGGFSGSSSSNYKGGGGGASHVASSLGLLSTLAGNQAAVGIVAGGGGGGGGASSIGYTGSGGNGGGVVGQDGILAGSQTTHNGKGGSQSAGGAGGVQGTSIGNNGAFGLGGDGGSVSGNAFPAGGGGGGWYGGGGGATQGGSGGGGSGYIGGVTNGITTQMGQPGFVANPDITGNGYVIITRLCDVVINASKNPICAGETITLGTNAGSGIQWNTGATTSSITVTPSVTTGYTVSGVSSSSSACSSTVSLVVTVKPLPMLSTYSFPQVVCQGGKGTLGASGAVSYTWSNGGTGASVIINPLVTDVYTVNATGANGCVNTETVMMNVNTNVLTVTQNSSICKGSTATLTANGVISALWSNGASFLTIQVAPTTNTVYNVTGQDLLGCMLTAAAPINVLNPPVVTITASKQTVCKGESITLSANGAATYVWDNAETTPSVTKTLPVDVPYQFAVTGTDANGCKTTAMITVNASACTGIAENEDKTISVFPNPATHEITVSAGGNGSKSIIVADVTGRVIMDIKTDASTYNINLEHLPSGLYHVRVVDGSSVKDQKFVKQ